MIERTKREDFVNKSLDEFFSYYEKPRYRDRFAIMGQLGLHSDALDVVLTRENYVNMPNDEGAPIELPFDDDSTKIAVLAVEPEREFVFTSGFHPLQRKVDGDRLGLGASTTRSILPPKARGAAVTGATILTDNDGKRALYWRRPTLVLPYDGSRTHEFSSILGHELTHVAQMLSNSVLHFESPEYFKEDLLIALIIGSSMLMVCNKLFLVMTT